MKNDSMIQLALPRDHFHSSGAIHSPSWKSIMLFCGLAHSSWFHQGAEEAHDKRDGSHTLGYSKEPNRFINLTPNPANKYDISIILKW